MTSRTYRTTLRRLQLSKAVGTDHDEDEKQQMMVLAGLDLWVQREV